MTGSTEVSQSSNTSVPSPSLTVVLTHTPPAKGWGGALMSASATAAIFQQIGVKTVLVASDGNGEGPPVTQAQAQAATGVPSRLYSARLAVALGFGLGAIPLLWRTIRESRSVYVSGVYTWPVTLAALFSFLLKKPYAICPHGGLLSVHLDEIRDNKPVKHLFFKFIVAPLVRSAALLRVTSDLEHRDVLAAFPAANVHVVPNAFAIEKFPFSPSKPQRPGRRMVFIGRLHKDKGIARFLKIWQGVAGPNDEVSVVGSGEGEYADSIRQLAASDHRILMRGELGRDDVYREIAEADLLILPSGIEGTLRENFGNVVVEALAIGRPAMVTKGLAWDSLPDKGLGVTFEANDDGIATAIGAVLNDTWLDAEDLPHRCRALAKSEFDEDSVRRGLQVLVRHLEGGNQ